MRIMRLQYVLAAALIGALAVATSHAETVDTRIGPLEFELGVPTRTSAEKLYDEMDFQRAVQAYLWALPIVGSAQAKLANELNTDAGDGDIAIYEGYRNVSVWLTANATTPYVVGYLDLARSGPIVVDVPPGAIAGTAGDFWQRPITDFGAVGPDEGKGGKYLFVGPGQEAPAADGYHVFRSPTFNMVYYYRALDADPAKAEAIKRGVRVYAYSQRDNPPEMKFVTPAADRKLVLSTPPSGMEYWERLAAVLNQEAVEDRDRFFMAMLKPLGIEKGKRFQPDARQTQILTEAATIGEAMANVVSFDKRFAGSRYRPDAHWDYAIMLDATQEAENYSELDERAAFFYELYGATKAMNVKIPGVGQAYLGAYRDEHGHPFDGAQTYRLRVPPNPPAKQFWSVTLYETDTRVLIQNEEQSADRSSRMDLRKNADGSVDIYMGPKPPTGFEKNWIPTVPGRAWFAYLRLYAPTEAYFDQSWPLPDIEKMN